MDRINPDKPTQMILDNSEPYPLELINKMWVLDTWTSSGRATIDVYVDEPFGEHNNRYRTIYRWGEKWRSMEEAKAYAAKLGMPLSLPDEEKRVAVQLIRRFHFEPGELVDVPRVYRSALNWTQCFHPMCAQRPFYCQDDTHEPKQTMGGLLPLGWRPNAAQRPKIHPSIEDKPAVETMPQPPIVEAIAPPLVKSPEALALERARTRRAAGGGQ